MTLLSRACVSPYKYFIETLSIRVIVYTQYWRVMDRQMDGQTSSHGIVPAMHRRRAVMIEINECKL